MRLTDDKLEFYELVDMDAEGDDDEQVSDDILLAPYIVSQ